MSRRFGIEGEMIYCINDDGSITNIAEIDLEDGDVRPVDTEIWYSELKEENDELNESKENYSKLLSLVSDTNKQISSTKSRISQLVSASVRGSYYRLSRIKKFRWFAVVCILLFISSSVITVLGDFSNMSFLLFNIPLSTISHVVVVILALISIVLLGIIYYNQNQLSETIQNLQDVSEKLSAIHCNENGVYDFVNQLNLSSVPLIINDVLIGNTDYNGNIETSYGNRISASNTMYLKPKVKYFGIKSGVQTLRIRWIKPDGTISKGNSSIGDFSQISGYNISAGKNDEICLSGWGGTNKGHWTAGQYFIEIWYEEIRLIRKPFTIF